MSRRPFANSRKVVNVTDKEIFEAIIAKLDDPLVEKQYE